MLLSPATPSTRRSRLRAETMIRHALELSGRVATISFGMHLGVSPDSVVELPFAGRGGPPGPASDAVDLAAVIADKQEPDIDGAGRESMRWENHELNGGGQMLGIAPRDITSWRQSPAP
jgi:hypothetical protein